MKIFKRLLSILSFNRKAIQIGDKVKIHCSKSRSRLMHSFDNKIGEVLHIVDSRHYHVRLSNGCSEYFNRNELKIQ